MKKLENLILSLLMSFSIGTSSAQTFVANYDEAKVQAFTLPDPLVFNNGVEVRNKKDWDIRRAEIYKLFENEVYGVAPVWKGKIISKELSSSQNALNGTAIRKEIRLTLRNGEKELSMVMLFYLPKSSKPVPVFLGYNFRGNHSVTEEAGISISDSWFKNDSTNGVTGNRASETDRGKDASSWQVREIISRGYGLATIYYGDVDPDFNDGFMNGVHGLYDQRRDSTSWGSISAWAWGLSRAMDYIETVSSIDSKKIIVMGHSRLGKTALWAGASDKRFALVISNNSGAGGAALARRIYGETVIISTSWFPYWYCSNYKKYSENENKMPVDMHMLLAQIAPRPLYVASAEEDLWADPKGEFLSCVGASPVYNLLGMKGLPASELPPVNSPVIGTIGYHIRTGGHGVTLYDWQQYLDFADLNLRKQ